MDPYTYFDKCHGSWVGKVTGSAFGMPFEGKNPRDIAKQYGQIAGWQPAHGPGGGVVNDDEQFELVALLCLEEGGWDNFTLPNLAKAWQQYLNPKYLFTAEKQVVVNWKKGIPVEEAALPAHNQWWDFIGAQMKGELFGQIAPGNVPEAARLARIDGAVAHHGIAIEGEVFVACMVSQAMDSTDIPTREMLVDDVNAALAECDAKDYYVKLMKQVIGWVTEHPEPQGWKKVFEQVEHWWQEETLPVLLDAEEAHPTHKDRKGILANCAVNPWQVCHVLPNAGIIAVALLYGAGDFSQTLQLAAMMGYDADCNVGNVGGIMGAYYGYEYLPSYWRDFTHDEILAVVKDWEDPSLENLARRVQKVAHVES